MARILFISTAVVFLVVLSVLEFSPKNEQSSSPLRRILQAEGQQQAPPPQGQNGNQQLKLNWNLPESTAKWCKPTNQNPLPYEGCDLDGPFNKIQFMAGLTNGLKMMLLQVIESFQQGRCIVITEENNHLLIRDDKSQQLDTFIGRYFEPIGLPLNHPAVERAERDGRVTMMNWLDVWDNSNKRRIHDTLHNITSLGMENIEGTVLKRVMLERMWHLQPKIREASCNSIEQMHGLNDEYLAFSVRRGDKDTEGFEFQKADTYIEPAEKAIEEHFNGKVPKIFVATDDCSIMPEFRELRPTWNFVSECDRSDGHSGFVLREMKDWTLEQTDEHFRKFFVEVIALAGAKYYIGVSYTNVAWWAHYMRTNLWSIQFLDSSTEHAMNNW